jgi:HEAT repeat protein
MNVQRIIEDLRHSSLDVRREAGRWALELGKEAAEAAGALVKALADEDAGVRWVASEALIELGQDAVPSLVRALGESDAAIRARVVRILHRVLSEG